MTYYEELAVAPTAPVAEIRRAYRRLAKVLHPDQHMDDAARRLAELQMKRLNGILAVLSDDVARAEYDASLRGEIVMSGRRILALEPIRNWTRDHGCIWGRKAAPAAAIVFLLVLTIPFRPRQNAAPPPAPAPELKLEAAKTPQRKAPQVPPARPRVAPPPIAAEPPPEIAAAPVLPEPPPIATLPPVSPLSPAPEPVPPKPNPTLSGRWLFAGSISEKIVGYPPEYIELRLTENSGVLHGRYQARYRIADRAISPAVAFRFDGQAGPEGGVLPWQGAGGSEGEVTLRLLPGGALKVDWVAHQLGKDLGLISGTATLVRKLE